MQIKVFLQLVLLLCIMSAKMVNGQVTLSGAGTGLGMGSMSGAAASVQVFAVTPSVEFKQLLLSEADMRLQFIYVRDFKSVIPNSNAPKYFSYLYGVSLSVFQSVPVTSALSLNYGLGALLLHDKTFSDINSTGAGFTVHARIEHALSEGKTRGLKLGIGSEYGQVFSVNSPGYFIYNGSVFWYF
ncbi:MAG: hypothetical protein HYV28_17575 [Ignavibacteriales bacterium]|nr:hypothetical protein [Ignavibacteriales bacterium]